MTGDKTDDDHLESNLFSLETKSGKTRRMKIHWRLPFRAHDCGLSGNLSGRQDGAQTRFFADRDVK
ncbi:hypothetical protein E2C01_092208 [Portunus trituberculatus]|uniref:Uncharacterized protein n=1 Tax=Portunus trituberculatus TaxID=210409 RepID=A0A5B7JRF0_PORTR|nr:hypothetical protein [Portunus trituberculatus]